jgi:AraC-like DNA-binding protein
MPSKINYAERVQLFIENNYIYPIKMIDIAKELHLSEKYMYRLFKEKFHIPPQKYLLKTRMESARTLLTRQHLSVKEVAHSVGYTSLPAFTKAFSHYWGQPPSFLKNNSGQTPMDSAR